MRLRFTARGLKRKVILKLTSYPILDTRYQSSKSLRKLARIIIFCIFS